MLIKRIEEVTLYFDNEKETLKRYEEIQALDDCTERRLYKDYSDEFSEWVYKITYKRIIYSSHFK